jgi:small subunit ribosomal protein S15
MNTTMIRKEEKNKIINDFKQHATDTGSIEVQVALLTKKIEDLKQHFKNNHKDFGSKRGLLSIVSKRKKCLQYLERMDIHKYKDIISRLGLRK